MEKLQVANIIQNAFLLPLSRFSLFSKTLAFPILLMVTIWSFWYAISPDSSILNIGFYLLYLIGFVYFAVTCHRLILIDNAHFTSIPLVSLYTLGRFTGLFIVVYLLSTLVEMAIITVFINVFDNKVSGSIAKEVIVNDSESQNEYFEMAEYIAYLPAMYIVGRLSLVFPATALGYKVGLKWSWGATKHNGIHILFIIALFPWALQIILSFMQRDNAKFVEQTALGILMYISAAIGIFALSLTYKDLKSIAEKKL